MLQLSNKQAIRKGSAIGWSFFDVRFALSVLNYSYLSYFSLKNIACGILIVKLYLCSSGTNTFAVPNCETMAHMLRRKNYMILVSS